MKKIPTKINENLFKAFSGELSSRYSGDYFFELEVYYPVSDEFKILLSKHTWRDYTYHNNLDGTASYKFYFRENRNEEILKSVNNMLENKSCCILYIGHNNRFLNFLSTSILKYLDFSLVDFS